MPIFLKIYKSIAIFYMAIYLRKKSQGWLKMKKNQSMQLIYQINSVNKKIHGHFNWCKEILIKLNFHSQPKTQDQNFQPKTFF